MIKCLRAFAIAWFQSRDTFDTWRSTRMAATDPIYYTRTELTFSWKYMQFNKFSRFHQAFSGNMLKVDLQGFLCVSI